MKLIIACTPSGGIGYKNKLPWSKIEGDLPRFNKLTNGKIVIMGRNTWDSLPKKPLPNRTNYIITSDPTIIPYYPASAGTAFAATMGTLDHFNENACIIGGAKLIEGSWGRITEVHLTVTFAEYTCDTFIDLIKLSKEFTCNQLSDFPDHSYQIWKRR